jgi:hypothetical protein
VIRGECYSDDGPLGPEGIRGARDDPSGANPYGVSSDDGSSDSDDNVEVPLDEAAKAVLKAWLSRTRQQLGLPPKGITRPDISTDDDSGESTNYAEGG